jgi:hypothetical protein
MLRPRARLPRVLFVAVLTTGGCGVALAADLTRFELDDGSVIVGEPLTLADGVYRIRTPALGMISVDASRVRSMVRAESADAAAAAARGSSPTAGLEPQAALSADIQSIQRGLVGDRGVMESIMALQRDPELQAVLADPELMGLVMSGNVEALRNHESFGRLINHPGIRAIIEQVVGPDGRLR